MVGFGVAYPLEAIGSQGAADWLRADGLMRNLSLMFAFVILTMLVVAGGVEAGIERWSKRLMPVLILTLVALVAYVATLTALEKDFASIWCPMLVS